MKTINWGLTTEVNYEQQIPIEQLLNRKININSTNFSKGQCQMLSFIRALMSDSKILLLDEATSSIDILTEKNIEELIDVEIKVKKRAVVVIAHRMETVKNCDLIYSLGSDGRIDATGTWKELQLGN
jgi:ATP-binding cassette subfamily B protein